ncbi:UPF0061-domain-containing protein [Neurospora crassa]|uniref:Selenoprotein O n=2 Tax=Neurospora crassa TaxID=5141 RepID=F5HCB9_NEUCR|nr:YdiU domain-containing protein [Neurospora crassa OR74A]EAA27945.3 YdiU domain-containing protein [Neurospora crassa OR74A]KHE83576.1 UPF0061-domain-containing protein [Neurospora crassa]|eukprot:XP_957181.3 YdiU domain-containing protein [Neurospora crassa OR74A]
MRSLQPAARCLALAQHLKSIPYANQPFSAFFSTTKHIMASNGTAIENGTHPLSSDGTTLSALPKSWHFTASLPPDAAFPTPADSHKADRDDLGPRQVKNAIFTWVRPEKQQDPELLAVSPAAMRDLGLALSEADTEEFRQVAVGNKIIGWDEETLSGPGYPWAQCYGGFQFGQWAGQLGDGRAISLFEGTNPATGVRYEVQLKGAGMTPYSRFADGKAVLRSSIREFIVSENLHALGIPSTRALAISLLPHSRVRRETMEPGAIVVRMAQSWLRFGNFDILRARGDRKLVRQLATYIGEEVFGGWDKLPGRLADPEGAPGDEPPRGIPKETIEGPLGAEENRFHRLYREIIRRNALTVAKWQIYGFMNGVLNTDNTSIMGLSIDFGPFAFMDNFDPNYTPNHDDFALRYSYRNQATIIWWNLVRLGEALGELIGAGPEVDSESFVTNGLNFDDEAASKPIEERAHKLITQAGEEFKAVFMGEFKRLFTARLGLKTYKESDFDSLFDSLLNTMEALELDYNLFFRRLSTLKTADLQTEEARQKAAEVFFSQVEEVPGPGTDKEKARKRVGEWLDKWRVRIEEDWTTSAADSEERVAAMKRVNPSFIPRGWILDEVIRRVEKQGERDVLKRVLHMATHPFEDAWTGKEFEDGPTGKGVYQGDKAEEERWTGDVPQQKKAMQCSCSS